MVENKPDTERPVEISADQLTEETLKNIVENFVLREGTDYGTVEYTLEKKIEQIKKQISRGETRIVFDVATETVSLLTESAFKKLMRGRESVD